MDRRRNSVDRGDQRFERTVGKLCAFLDERFHVAFLLMIPAESAALEGCSKWKGNGEWKQHGSGDKGKRNLTSAGEAVRVATR